MKKIDWNNKYTTIAVYVFLVVAACLLFYAAVDQFDVIWEFFRTIVRYLLPFIYGFVLAYILSPLVRRMEAPLRKSGRLSLKACRGLAMAGSYLLVAAALSIFGMVVLPVLVESAAQLVGNVRFYTERLNELINQLITYIPDETLSKEVQTALTQVFNLLYEFIATFLTQVVSVATKIASSVIEVVMGVIISVYMLSDKEKLIAQLKKILSAFLPKRVMDEVLRVAHDSNQKFSGFITGKIIDSTIIGIICALGMLFFKMPFVALVSLIVGITNVIPYFGPFIGAVPGVILVLIGGDITQAILFGVFILGLQQFDGNILGPAILGQSTGLSAMWVVFAILLFGGLYGFVGMLIGVPLLAVMFGVLRSIVNGLLRRKGMSTDARDYASDQHPIP
ncbi:MAG: AI-2E family transporter [Angelakisella sp.]|nr:AI-2E family transporter [Angelakisella sp.]MCI9665732.1 AI-2E family transporter [Angelakisella sp.]